MKDLLGATGELACTLAVSGVIAGVCWMGLQTIRQNQGKLAAQGAQATRWGEKKLGDASVWLEKKAKETPAAPEFVR